MMWIRKYLKIRVHIVGYIMTINFVKYGLRRFNDIVDEGEKRIDLDDDLVKKVDKKL